MFLGVAFRDTARLAARSFIPLELKILLD